MGGGVGSGPVPQCAERRLKQTSIAPETAPARWVRPSSPGATAGSAGRHSSGTGSGTPSPTWAHHGTRANSRDERKGVVEGKGWTGRCDAGGVRHIKKKKQQKHKQQN